jgi:GTP cyclohydrolase IV
MGMTDLAVTTHRTGDVQADRPATALALSHVGVSGVEKAVRVGPEDSAHTVFCSIDCSVDLPADQRGAHMSRFDEAIEAAIEESVLEGAFSVDALAARIAERVRERQGAARALVEVRARFPRLRSAPASGTASQEISTALAAAVASGRGTRRMFGVEAEGMTACPCGQAMATADARARLAADGFDDAEIERVLACVPIATHNQRGIGKLWVGPSPDASSEPPALDELLEIVESSMSSEIYELLKRPDEAHVVEKAHRRPRFVEDCVREMLRLSVERLAGLGEDTFLTARQENLETIHRHEVVAERSGLLGELRAELEGERESGFAPTRAEWLAAAT